MPFTHSLRDHGWARGELVIGDASVELLASYLTDALGDLLMAMAALVRGASRTSTPWVEEPGSNRWVFERTTSVVRVTVRHDESLLPEDVPEATDSRPLVFDAWCGVEDLCRAVAEGAREVQKEFGLDGYRARWRAHEFPLEQLVVPERAMGS